MRARPQLPALGLLLLASAAGGQPPHPTTSPIIERVLPPGVRPVLLPRPRVHGPEVPPLVPPVTPPRLSIERDEQLAEHLAHLERLHLQLKEFEAKLTEEQRKAAAPFVVGRVVVVGFTPDEDQRALTAVDKAGIRPGLTVVPWTVEHARGLLLTAGLRAEVTVLPADAKSERRDVRVRALPAIQPAK